MARRLKRLTVDLVGATVEQIAQSLVKVDQAKAAAVAARVAQLTVEEGGAVARALEAADADPLGLLARLAGAAVAHSAARPTQPPGPAQVEWDYEDP